MPIAAIGMAVIGAKGRGGLFFGIGLAKNTVTIIVLAFTFRHGILPVVIGQSFVAVLNHFCLNAPAVKSSCGYSLFDQLADFFPYLLAALFAGSLHFGLFKISRLESFAHALL